MKPGWRLCVRDMEVGGESAGAAGIRSLAHCEEPATAPGLARQHEEPGLLELPHASAALIGRLWAVGTPRLPDGRYRRHGIMRTAAEAYPARQAAEAALWAISKDGRADYDHDRPAVPPTPVLLIIPESECPTGGSGLQMVAVLGHASAVTCANRGGGSRAARDHPTDIPRSVNRPSPGPRRSPWPRARGRTRRLRTPPGHARRAGRSSAASCPGAASSPAPSRGTAQPPRRRN